MFGEALGTAFEEYKKELYDADADGSTGADDLPLAYVHLSDARIAHPTGFVPQSGDGMHLRLRIDEIQGWSMSQVVTT